MPITIDISRQSELWDVSDVRISEVVNVALLGFEVEETELSVVLADDGFVQNLNRDYRDKDKPTNVLSFPQDSPMLGDVVLAYETVKREAEEQDKAFEDHVAHLLVHGVLHLLGYDHENDEDAEEMEALEVEILNGLVIANPYA